MFKPNFKRLLVPAMCLVLIVSLSTTCLAQHANAPHANAPHKNARVPATVTGVETADLYAKLGGYIKSVAVDIGDDVTAGQILAEIDAPETEKQLAQKRSLFMLAQAEANQAKARIEEAKAHLDALKASVEEAKTMRSQKEALAAYERTECARIQALVAQGAIQNSLLDAANFKLLAAESELNAVAAKVATANANLAGGRSAVLRSEADAAASEAQIAVAQSNIDYVTEMIKYSTIRAPWPGKVTERLVDPGAFVQSAAGNSAAKPLIRLVRDDQVRVVFSLSQKNLAGLKKGLKVTLAEIDALPEKSFAGVISRFSAELDPQTRMMRVEMDLDNADGQLKPGFFGYATVEFE